MRITRWLTIWAAASGLFLLHNLRAADDAGLSQLRNAAGLADPLYRWNAELVGLSKKRDWDPLAAADNDYATCYYHDAWDFDEGDTEGIAKFSEGIQGVTVKDGKLEFTTAERAYFYWGDHFDGDAAKGLHIGFNWPVDMNVWAWRWYVQMRVRQSLPQSTWNVYARRAGTPPKLDRGKATVKGTDWQIVNVNMGGAGPGGYTGVRRHSLCFELADPGNKVEIDWVRVVRVLQGCTRIYIRQVVELTGQPREAAMCLLPFGRAKLYINGQPANSCVGLGLRPGQRHGIKRIDVSRLLRKGRNVIAYEDDTYNRPHYQYATAYEGFVLFKDGAFQRFFSDKSCRMSFEAPAGWTSDAFDDRGWAAVRSWGNMADSTLPGRGPQGLGPFIDPPYLGPIRVDFPDKDTPDDTPPIFRVSKGVRLVVRLPKRRAAPTLSYTLKDAFSGKTVQQGKLEPQPSEGPDITFEFKAKPKQPGVFDLMLRAQEAGKVLDTRLVELAVVGKIPQREVAWDQVEAATKLRLVDEVDCGDPNDPHPYMEHPAVFRGRKPPAKPTEPITRLGELNGVRYRETGKAFADWFSYEVHIEHPWRPHMVVIDYPDDREMALVARPMEPRRTVYRRIGFYDTARANVCVVTGGPLYPNTGKMQSARFIYFPQHKRASIDIENMCKGGGRAAVARIRVYEIEDMPAVALPHAVPGRLIGTQTERAPLRLHTFYAGPEGNMFRYAYCTNLYRHYGFLRNWYITFANQIRYMRFAGQNLCFCGFWMYHGTYWPSAKLDPRGSTPTYDNFALMYAMFEENGLALVPCIEFCRNNDLVQANSFTDREVREGADTLVNVSKEGKQMPYASCANNYNPFHPRVQKALVDIADEIVARYGRYGSFRGIGYISGGLCEPCLYVPPHASSWEEALDIGWEDITIKLFEQRTGIKVPVDMRDPDRFAKRYRWVMENHRQEWIDFRCREMLDVHLKILAAIRKAGPKARYYLFGATVAPISLADYVVQEGQSCREAFRMLGFDPELYKGRKGLALGWDYAAEGWGRVATHVEPGVLKTFNTLPTVNRLLDNRADTCCFIHGGFVEPDVQNIFNKDWVWSGSSQVNPNPWMSGRYYAEELAERIEQSTPSNLTFIWTDGQMYTSQENLSRPFAAAFRSIPLAEYHTLEGHGLHGNLVFREAVRDGKRFLYVVNPSWWRVTADVQFAGQGAVLDRVNGRALALQDGRARLTLPNYGVVVLEMPKAVSLAGADTSIDAEGKRWFVQTAELLEYLETIGPLKTIRLFSFAEPPEQTHMRVLATRQAIATGLYAQARGYLEHPWLLKLVSYLKEKRAHGQDAAQRSYRVIIGSDKPYTDSQGREWLPDQFYQYGLKAYGYVGNGGTAIHRGDVAIANTKDPEIYRTERFNFTGYRFRVPNGTYTVRLLFAEGWKFGLGRVFDVTVEGKTLLKDYDFNAEAGAVRTAVVKTLKDIEVSDGELTIDFAPARMTRIHGIEVEPQQ